MNDGELGGSQADDDFDDSQNDQGTENSDDAEIIGDGNIDDDAKNVNDNYRKRMARYRRDRKNMKDRGKNTT